MAEDTTYLSHRIWKYQSGTDLEALSLLASFQGWKMLCTVLEEKNKLRCHQAVNSVSYNNDWSDKV